MTMTWPGHDYNMTKTWKDTRTKTWPNITETWPKHERDMTVTWTRTWHTWPGHDYSLTKTWPGTVSNMTKTEVWHDWDRTRTWQDQEITLMWPWHVRNMTWDMTTSWHVHHRHMASMVPNSIQARPPCHYRINLPKNNFPVFWLTSPPNFRGIHFPPSSIRRISYTVLKLYIGSCLNTIKPVQSVKVKTGLLFMISRQGPGSHSASFCRFHNFVHHDSGKSNEKESCNRLESDRPSEDKATNLPINQQAKTKTYLSLSHSSQVKVVKTTMWDWTLGKQVSAGHVSIH